VRALVNGGVQPCVPEMANASGVRFVLIPDSSFWMGAAEGEGRDFERPRHRVTLTRPFWLGVFPVTQAQYQTFGKNPAAFSKKGASRSGSMVWIRGSHLSSR
jgi:formylglycine-generating enzyme required for sulfatase activity